MIDIIVCKGDVFFFNLQGFHRYSTDREWHVPHFEKMLYDQSQIADIYLNAYQVKSSINFAMKKKTYMCFVFFLRIR